MENKAYESIITHPLVHIRFGKAATTSHKLARMLEKRHYDVFRDISEILYRYSEPYVTGIMPCTYADSRDGSERKMFALTRAAVLGLIESRYGSKEYSKQIIMYNAAFDEKEDQIRRNTWYVTKCSTVEEADAVWNTEWHKAMSDWKNKNAAGNTIISGSFANNTFQARTIPDEDDNADNWKPMSAIPWIRDVFIFKKGFYTAFCKYMNALSVEMGYENRILPDSQFANTAGYHTDVIAEFRRRVQASDVTMKAFRK